MSNKYPNGMYKCPSKKQDKFTDMLWKTYLGVKSMGFDFNQESGYLKINITNRTDNSEINFTIDLNANIIQIHNT